MSNSDADNQTCQYLKYHSISETSDYERDNEDEKDVFNETFEVDNTCALQKTATIEQSSSEVPKRFRVHRLFLLQGHEDFQMKTDIFLSIETFNWEEHAYSILYNYIPQIADKLNA
jgi:hypothetical protein